MATLVIHLFGRAAFAREGEPLSGFHPGKFQELFCYLLLQRERSLSREALAGVFWGDCTTVQSRKYLRQALWHLQSALNAGTDGRQTRVLKVEPNSVGIDLQADIWLDVAIFEQAFALSQGTAGQKLNEQQAGRLMEAMQLYRGDLLEGWYQDWCLFQRERLQNMYFAVLDKLMCYCEIHSLYQAGLEYGERVLSFDRAHERTHQRMLRLIYLSGDRAGALRHYERCVRALAEELNVKPAARTLQLYEQIRADCVHDSEPTPVPATTISAVDSNPSALSSALLEALHQLRGLEEILIDTHLTVQENVRALEHLLRRAPVGIPEKRRAG